MRIPSIPVLLSGLLAAAAPDLVVPGAVPGLEPSPHYTLAVRLAGSAASFTPAFAMLTSCKEKGDKPKVDNYFPHLSGWTHTYINLEMKAPIEVEISRANGEPIRKAAPHPKRRVASCEIRGGKAYVILEQAALVAVDIDGQMDDQDTGKTPDGAYAGPPIHTVSIFANPPLPNCPRPDGPGVFAVKPGTMPPADGAWKTLYFLPGVHDIGAAFPILHSRDYYIPGDAIVYGGFNSGSNWNNGHDIRIFGLGTLSGARMAHPKFLPPGRGPDSLQNPIHVLGAANTRVEGITLADSAHHSLMLISGFDPQKPTDIRWVKIFTWRGNGDGINPFGNGLLEDCFIRTQDDSTYVNGRGLRRLVLWNDWNGSSFVLSALPKLADRTLVVEDCDVIYARAGWHQWAGGRVFNMRGEGRGECGAGVVFRDIRVEDSRPTLQAFSVQMQMQPPYGKSVTARKPGDLCGVVFQNVSLAAPSILKEPEILYGMEGAWIRDLSFENFTVGGRKITSAEFFTTNAFVKNLIFR